MSISLPNGFSESASDVPGNDRTPTGLPVVHSKCYPPQTRILKKKKQFKVDEIWRRHHSHFPFSYLAIAQPALLLFLEFIMQHKAYVRCNICNCNTNLRQQQNQMSNRDQSIHIRVIRNQIPASLQTAYRSEGKGDLVHSRASAMNNRRDPTCKRVRPNK